MNARVRTRVAGPKGPVPAKTSGFREHDARIRYHVNGDPVQNFGDYLPELFAKEFLLHPRVEADAYRLVGSVIDPVWILKDLRERVGVEAGKVAFWCCGLRGSEGLAESVRPFCDFFGVRGPRTRDGLRLPAATVLGDPGLLVPLLHQPAVSAATAGRVMCMPHIHDTRSDSELLALGGADVVVRPKIFATEAALREVFDKLASADFVLTASLHGAIIAAAYGTPFAFWDNGHLDVPFKWQDFTESVGMPCHFVKTVALGRQHYREEIAPAYRGLPLTPILDVCPFNVRPTVLLQALVHDGELLAGDAARLASVFERLPSAHPQEVQRLQQESARYREERHSLAHTARRQLGNVREALWGKQPEFAKAIVRKLLGRPAPAGHLTAAKR